MPDASLLLLATEVRGKTLRLLKDVTEEQALFTGTAGLSNSILWHAGHSVTVVEALCNARAEGRAPAYPAGWFEMFSWESKPATVKSWPTLAAVVKELESQIASLTAVIPTLSDARLNEVIDPAKGRTLRYSILHGLHDEAGHQGEIYLLKKLWAKR